MVPEQKAFLKRETLGMEIQCNIYLAPSASFIAQQTKLPEPSFVVTENYSHIRLPAYRFHHIAAPPSTWGVVFHNTIFLNCSVLIVGNGCFVPI